MELPVNPSQLIDLLRAWFFAKDRSVVLADNTFIEGEDISTPGTPIINRGRLYWKDKCWHQLDEDGLETTLCNGLYTDWTPTVDQGGAVAATVVYARYVVLAQTVIMQARLNITGTGTAGNAIIISGLPTSIQPANAGAEDDVIGSGIVKDTGTAFYGGVLVATGADDLRFIQGGQNNTVGIAPSFALTNGDRIGFQAAYER